MKIETGNFEVPHKAWRGRTRGNGKYTSRFIEFMESSEKVLKFTFETENAKEEVRNCYGSIKGFMKREKLESRFSVLMRSNSVYVVREG